MNGHREMINSRKAILCLVVLAFTMMIVQGLSIGGITGKGKVGGRPNITIKKLNIIPHSLSVSGLSSGAFMAVQFQYSFSAAIVGAGIFAGR